MELTILEGYHFIEWTLLGVFLSSFLIQLFFSFYFYLRLFRSRQPEKSAGQKKITILLCVRNEEDRILEVIKNVNEQAYSFYEVVAVDDFSEDQTLQYIGSMTKKYPRTRVTSLVQETRFSEKISINLGLKASKSDWVYMVPVSMEKLDCDVLTVYNDYLLDGVDVVLGYSNYKAAKGGMNKLARIEKFVGFMRSASYSIAGFPLVFSENNVCFNKKIYFDHEGFKGKLNQFHANLELIFNQYSKNITVALSEKTFIKEVETVTRQDYINLVRKELLLRRALGAKRRMILLLDDFSKVLFLLSYILLLIFNIKAWVLLTTPFLLLSLFGLLIVKKNADRLNEGKIFISSFMYILIKPLINIYHSTTMYVKDRRSKWN